MNIQTATAAPPAPRDLDEVGLGLVMPRDILLKTVFRANAETVTDVARALAVTSRVAQELLDLARGQQLLEAVGTMRAGSEGGDMPYRLTESGKARALDALAQSEYFGALPVPLDAYAEQVKRQSIRNVTVTRQALADAMEGLVLPEGLLSDLGPAVGAGRSILLYGPPGNGKSSISNGIRRALGDAVHMPRALAYSGQVITVYDPIVHQIADAPEEDPNALRRRTIDHDRRYVLCRRPTVITGGELRLDMLDLTYNATARTYQAPLQLKSTGGVFIVDDLGRQEEPPQSLINRWIVPMEEGHDILALQSGEKFTVPFDTLVVFSTNFHPNELFDSAALRRIFFKIRVDGPTQEDFLEILGLVARAKGMPLDEASLVHLLGLYPEAGLRYASYQPVFLIDQMIAICDFEGVPYAMTPELVDRAWANMFVREEDVH